MNRSILSITSPELNGRGEKEMYFQSCLVAEFQPRDIVISCTWPSVAWVFHLMFWWAKVRGRPTILVSRIETDTREVFVIDPPAPWVRQNGRLIISNCQWYKMERFQ